MQRKRKEADGQRAEADDGEFAVQAYLGLQQLALSLNMADDPVVVRALRFIKGFPRNRELVEEKIKIIESRLKPFIKVRDAYPDPFEPCPSQATLSGEILIGSLEKTGAPFGLNLDELNQHVLITGRAGSGKTTLIYILLHQLMEKGVPFWAFDFKRDYRHLSRHGRLIVLNTSNLRFNPLYPPTGVPLGTWMQDFTNIFCQSYGLREGGEWIILNSLNSLFQEYAAAQAGYPSVHDLLEFVKAYKPDSAYGKEATYLQSVKARLGQCALSLNDAFDCSQGLRIEDLLRENVVLEIEGLVAGTQAFLINVLMRYVFMYRMYSGVRAQGLKHVFLFDEAKIIFNRDQEYKDKNVAEETSKFVSMIREFGEGLITADQMPQKVSDVIRGNLYTTICLSQSGGQNLFEMGRALGLNAKQQEALSCLVSDKSIPLFQAVVKLSGKWPKPFLINIPAVSITKDVSDTELSDMMRPLLAGLSATATPRVDYKEILDRKKKAEKERAYEEHKKRVEQQEETDKVEGYILIKILTHIRDKPFVDQKTRIQELGLGSSSTADKYFKELILQGYSPGKR